MNRRDYNGLIENEWVCNECPLAPCFEYQKEQPTICYKKIFKPKFKSCKGVIHGKTR